MTSARDILRAVAEEAGVDLDVMLGLDRSWRMARIRQIAMLLLREHGTSWHQIKIAVKRGDHTTIIEGCKAMRSRLERPDIFPEWRSLHDRVVARLGAMEATQP